MLANDIQYSKYTEMPHTRGRQETGGGLTGGKGDEKEE